MKTEKQIRRRISKERKNFNEAIEIARTHKVNSDSHVYYYNAVAIFSGYIDILEWVLKIKKRKDEYTN